MVNSPIISTEAGWKKLQRRQKLFQRLLIAAMVVGCIAPFVVLHFNW